MRIHKAQVSEPISRFIEFLFEWPLSYPYAGRPRRGAGNYQRCNGEREKTCTN
jgi:hypothetical protein